MTIGMVINSALKPSRDAMLGIMDNIRAFLDVRLRFFHASAATLPQHLVSFASSGIDGLIFSGVRRNINVRFARAMPNHPPAVLLTYYPLQAADWKILGNGGVVILDNEALGQQAANYFYTHGLQHFAFFGTNVYRERIAANIRCDAFRNTLVSLFGSQMTFSSLMTGTVCDNEDYWDSDAAEIEDWMKSLPTPCGILANGDREAFGLLEFSRRLGIDVPSKIEVLGVNNAHRLCAKANPAISSIMPDLHSCAKEAVRLMLEIIENPNLPREKRSVKIASHRLEERGSTVSGRGYGQVVTRAREFIRLNACSGITVAEVAKGIGVPLRTLETRVTDSTGESIHAMIRAVRLEKVCELLTTTNLSISEVTTQSGYRLMTSLGALFKKIYGMSMRQYRMTYRVPRSWASASS